MTYSTLQNLNLTSEVPVAYNIDPNFIPRDDESLSKYLSQKYTENGIDPSAAFDSPDDAIHDFGGPQGFI
jgi:hypothetical protein